MKSALQTIPRESSRPDSDLAIAFPPNHVIQLLPDRIPVQPGQTVQWQWDNNFSVSITSGVFENKPISAVQQPDGSYLTVPPLRVTGQLKKEATCTYKSLPDAAAADTDTDPPPPPPPNVVIVDNSVLKGSSEK